MPKSKNKFNPVNRSLIYSYVILELGKEKLDLQKTIIISYGNLFFYFSILRFSINLLRNKDFAFHFNPRFDEDGIKVIVRNSMVNDVWGQEERIAPSFPFVQGKPFEVSIIFEYADLFWFSPAHIDAFWVSYCFLWHSFFPDILCNLFSNLDELSVLFIFSR